MFGVSLVMEQGPLCANILAHRCPPPPIGNPDQAWWANNVSRIFFCVRSAITIGAGGFGAPIVLADYKEDDWFRAHTNFHTNRLLIELYKQETEIRCRKDEGPIKK